MSSSPVVIQPQAGPQTMAAESVADVLIFGGEAGGGKSYLMAIEPTRNFNVPGFGGVLFRRTSPEITGAGSIWEECKGLYRHFPNSHMREGSFLDWRFSMPEGDAVFEFRHLQHENDVHAHQSKQYALIEFDELTHFTEYQFWYMFSRNRSGCGVRPYIRASCNPDPDSFVAGLVDWYLDEAGYPDPKKSGVLRYMARVDDELHWAEHPQILIDKFPQIFDVPGMPPPKSFTFIHSSLRDNKKLMEKDPSYAANIAMLPKVEQERLGKGNWKIRAQRGDFFMQENFVPRDSRPDPSQILQVVRGWDKAASKPTPKNPNPDWTANVLMARLRDGSFCIMDARRTQQDPPGVKKFVYETTVMDGPRTTVAFWQDPGGAGKETVYHDTKDLAGFRVVSTPAREEKSTYANPFSAQVGIGNVSYVRAPWNKAYFAEMEGFAGKNTVGKDDWVDASSRAFMELAHSKLARLAALGRYRSHT